MAASASQKAAAAASPASPKTPPRLRAAAARVARVEALQQRMPSTHSLFGLVCVLLKAALVIQLVVAGVERLRLLTALTQPDYYYENGKPPRPNSFDELVKTHHSQFRHWFRVDTPRYVCMSGTSACC